MKDTLFCRCTSRSIPWYRTSMFWSILNIVSHHTIQHNYEHCLKFIMVHKNYFFIYKQPLILFKLLHLLLWIFLSVSENRSLLMLDCQKQKKKFLVMYNEVGNDWRCCFCFYCSYASFENLIISSFISSKWKNVLWNNIV